VEPDTGLASGKISTISESTISTWKMKRAPRSREKDELEDFISSTTNEIDNPRLWRIQHQKGYPQLSRMVLDLLAIPAMSAEVDRVFSSTGVMVTDRRNRLWEDVVEVVECMKSWSADGGIVSFKYMEQVQTRICTRNNYREPSHIVCVFPIQAASDFPLL